MAKRLFDIVFSLIGLIISLPFFLPIAVGIKLSSPGPVFYKAQRVGLNGNKFAMHKFRTMHVRQGPSGSAITGVGDKRVFPFGALLRKLKIDEVPQFYDVLRGKMSIVGPRPEDPVIVKEYFNADYLETLRVLPGLVSPCSIYDYTHGEQFLKIDNHEDSYIKNFLPVRMALELSYIKKSSFLYDLKIIARTAYVIFLVSLGKKTFKEPPEVIELKINNTINTNNI